VYKKESQEIAVWMLVKQTAGASTYFLHLFVICLSFFIAILQPIKNKKGSEDNMKKTLPALVAAFVITFIIGVWMLFVGGNALFNSDGITVSNSPIVANAQSASGDQAAQIAQLQSQIAQYQTREAQYQQELAQAATQIQTANQKMQQVQMLLSALQSRGIITIGSDGRIFLNQ
jgi:hypothetical protein